MHFLWIAAWPECLNYSCTVQEGKTAHCWRNDTQKASCGMKTLGRKLHIQLHQIFFCGVRKKAPRHVVARKSCPKTIQHWQNVPCIIYLFKYTYTHLQYKNQAHEKLWTWKWDNLKRPILLIRSHFLAHQHPLHLQCRSPFNRVHETTGFGVGVAKAEAMSVGKTATQSWMQKMDKRRSRGRQILWFKNSMEI